MKTALALACKPLFVGALGISVLGGGAITTFNALSAYDEPIAIATEEEGIIVEGEPETMEVALEVSPSTQSIEEISKPKGTPTTPTAPKTTDTVSITKEDPHGAASYNGMSRIQYEDAVKYTCPSQREENIFETWRPAMSRLISIGKYSAYAPIGREVPDNGVYTIIGAPQAYLELTWDRYKQYPSQFTEEGSFLVSIENKTVRFYINWNTLTVSWGKEDRDKVSTSLAEMADYLSGSWTSYLQQLNSSYKTRCPND